MEMWLGCTSIFYLGTILEDFSRAYSKEIKKMFYIALVSIWNLYTAVETSLFTREKYKVCLCFKIFFI